MSEVKIIWKHKIPQDIKDITSKTVNALWKSLELATVIIGNESNKQVPFDVGTLSDSWDVESLNDRLGYRMKYSTDYASKMHEHPEYRFKNGRKAKFLEDPIKNNEGDWIGHYFDKLKTTLK